MPYYRKQLPKYCHHKATGRAFVRIGGKMIYLGKHGSESSRREYDKIIAEFVANGRQAFLTSDELLVEGLIARYLDYVEKELTLGPKTRNKLSVCFRLLNKLYGKQLVIHFSAAALKSIRRQYLERGLARKTINDYIHTIRQVFDWGCEEEIVPPEIAGALRMVKNLQKGKSTAAELDPVKPVSDEIIEKTLKFVTIPQVIDMVRVQKFICGRPQDMHNMRYCDIDQSGEIWKYTPFTHKTEKRGKIRILPIGPRAQKILKPYLERCKETQEQFVFPWPESNKKGPTYYANAIKAACKKAGIPKWSPNQLRHSGGTEVRKKFGLDAAQAILGHASAKTTEIYAKVAFEKAAKVAKKIV